MNTPPPVSHYKLLQYINNIVRNTCPSYLYNDRDDIAQTVLIRLLDKIKTMTTNLEQCCYLAGKPTASLADVLGKCLDDMDMCCDLSLSEDIKIKLRQCLSWIRDGQGSIRKNEILLSLEKCLEWFRDHDGIDLLSKFYIQRGVHWGIMDVKKRLNRRAEISTEDTEESQLERSKNSQIPSWQRDLEIREEIAVCLSRLDEAKRRPTMLALLGYQYSEIAEFLGLSIPQTDSRVRRGKAFLRDCLYLKGVSP